MNTRLERLLAALDVIENDAIRDHECAIAHKMGEQAARDLRHIRQAQENGAGWELNEQFWQGHRNSLLNVIRDTFTYKVEAEESFHKGEASEGKRLPAIVKQGWPHDATPEELEDEKPVVETWHVTGSYGASLPDLHDGPYDNFTDAQAAAREAVKDYFGEDNTDYEEVSPDRWVVNKRHVTGHSFIVTVECSTGFECCEEEHEDILTFMLEALSQ